MTNLFTVFDPCTGTLSLNWLSSIIMYTMVPMKFWLLPSNNMMIIKTITLNLIKEIKMILPYKKSTLPMMSLFLMIMYNNVMGILPYVFTSSSHLTFSLSMALPMWMAFMIFGWLKKTNLMFIHMVPNGTPSILMPFMVMIETISNLIRPGSLAVRLTANMIAGHLLMSLLGTNTVMSSVILSFTITVYIMLMLFESAVAMIQSYVFMTLTTLYSSET
uniref:ATP synthase F0 subunit 6 n=1 Tax=Jogocerus viraktamathi TaxID=3111112 RepID=UPI002E7874C1|nr:ATP synthase F0 subunit 6 [Jogocerus viraktamathi]WRK19230.1 ATP synthase F0 subunit 6 [Jogocerus viraktamathi]